MSESWLFRGGFDKHRPLVCPEEFWTVIMRCWRELPGDRYRFTELDAAVTALLQTVPA